ncbi:MAG: RNA polymerase sigma-70 factor (ECF subfamily) [Limisphaerales bacterium]|jgi:RNA polymerase sigma-70 factor (ECF subfamily)
MAHDLGPILSAAYPQVVATLIRVLGDMDRATDATQDALVKALQVWGSDGIPDNPVAWLVTVGRNKAVDQIRRDQRSVSYEGNVVALVSDDKPFESIDYDDVDWQSVDDDMLRLLFTCCHPALPPAAQIVLMLMLKVVLGFSIEEISRGLLASSARVEKRVTRAKAKLRAAEVPYEVPSASEIPVRLDAVLRAIYLIFNEGYTRIQDGSLSRGSLIDTAIRLGRIASRLFRHDPQPRALVALMLLSAARQPARVDGHGVFVPLHEQDREQWNKGMIQEGVAVIDAVYAARHLPGGYQIQAAKSKASPPA